MKMLLKMWLYFWVSTQKLTRTNNVKFEALTSFFSVAVITVVDVASIILIHFLKIIVEVSVYFL